MTSIKFSLIIPCYDEEGNIPILIKQCKQIFKHEKFEVIFVENGSNDNSLNIQANIPKKLIKYINEKCKSTLRNKNSSIFIGQLMSEPDLDITFIKKRYSLQQLMNNKKEQILYFDVASRGIYFDNFFFINGVHVPLTKNLFNFFKKFFDNKECCINFCKKNPELIRIIIELLNDGFIHLNSPKFKV